MREKIAAIQHEIWSSWMEWLFECSVFNEDDTVTIPANLVLRWLRQIKIDYLQLTEREKESDQRQADKVLEAIK